MESSCDPQNLASLALCLLPLSLVSSLELSTRLVLADLNILVVDECSHLSSGLSPHGETEATQISFSLHKPIKLFVMEVHN